MHFCLRKYRGRIYVHCPSASVLSDDVASPFKRSTLMLAYDACCLRLSILQQRVDDFDTQQTILQIALFVTSFMNSPKSLLCGTICASFFLVVCFLRMVKPFPKMANKDGGPNSLENTNNIKTAPPGAIYLETEYDFA